MKQLSMHPTIHKFDSAREFADAFHLGKGDVVLTNRYLWGTLLWLTSNRLYSHLPRGIRSRGTQRHYGRRHHAFHRICPAKF